MGEDDETKNESHQFRGKSVMARMSVIAAGPFFNFLLALILAVFLGSCIGYLPNKVGSVEEGSAAEDILRAGDEIIEINGSSIEIYEEIYYKLNGTESATITYQRDGEAHTIRLESKEGKYGIIAGQKEKSFSIVKAVRLIRYDLVATIDGLRALILHFSPDNVSGPIGIVDVMNQTYHSSGSHTDTIYQLLKIAILLSVNLGVMNLLPVPALDGGRLLFLAVEGIRKKALKGEAEANLIGFAVLMILMILIMGKDIVTLLR